MRGKGSEIRTFPSRLRITPAYAGKSERGCQNERKKRDHPRLCGEKLGVQEMGISLLRITPAYAGKSILKIYHRPNQSGSPPPMRGKAETLAAAEPSNGITPAYAGKSVHD